MNAVFFIVSFVVALALADDPHKLEEVHKKCQSDPALYIDEAVIDKLMKNPGTTSDIPANLGKHMQCLAKGLNLINEEGKINLDGVKSHIQQDIKEMEKVDAYLKKCAVEQATIDETVNHMWKCLRDNDILRHVGHDHHGESGSSSEEHKHPH